MRIDGLVFSVLTNLRLPYAAAVIFPVFVHASCCNAAQPKLIFVCAWRAGERGRVRVRWRRADDAGRPAYPKVRVVTVSECASYRVKRPGDHGTRHNGPVTISLVNHRNLILAV
jgi:hypothetical protein